MEADCLDWALILALMLRDAMALLRLVNLARSALSSNSNGNVDVETVTRLRDGLLALSHWIETDCPGYRPFIAAIHTQIGSLTKLIIPSKIASVLNQQSTQPSADGCDLATPPITSLGVVSETEQVQVEAEAAQTCNELTTTLTHEEESVRQGSSCVIS